MNLGKDLCIFRLYKLDVTGNQCLLHIPVDSWVVIPYSLVNMSMMVALQPHGILSLVRMGMVHTGFAKVSFQVVEEVVRNTS